ncbi:hypothetical protein AB0N81_30045 [Streptomyces sp. NPDC093510]|uniref:hypothetical protein n=1 Tax=Streptomyces sp. NPDC093510 TaxID=3155199 RepID=UPI00341EB8F7
MFEDLGPAGIATALTALLISGIPGDGKLKPLGWWTTLPVAMLAASAYKAAGGPFTIVPDAAGTVIDFMRGLIKGLTIPALTLTVAIFVLYKKLTTKQLGFVALLFFYLAQGAGGNWTYLPTPSRTRGSDSSDVHQPSACARRHPTPSPRRSTTPPSTSRPPPPRTPTRCPACRRP